MNKVLYQAIVFAALLMHAGFADAYGSLRCKGRLIDVGESLADVRALCGAPTLRIVRTVPTRAAVASGYTRFTGLTTMEQWIYDRGWGKFPAVLYIDDGTIRRIEHLAHRSGDE